MHVEVLLDTTEEGEKLAPLCVDREVSLYRTDLRIRVWGVQASGVKVSGFIYRVSPELRMIGIETVVYHHLEKKTTSASRIGVFTRGTHMAWGVVVLTAVSCQSSRHYPNGALIISFVFSSQASRIQLCHS